MHACLLHTSTCTEWCNKKWAPVTLFLAKRADFCMKFYTQLLNNKIYILPPSFVEIYFKMTNLCWEIEVFFVETAKFGHFQIYFNKACAVKCILHSSTFVKNLQKSARVAEIALQKSQVFTFYLTTLYIVAHPGRRRRKRSFPGATLQREKKSAGESKWKRLSSVIWRAGLGAQTLQCGPGQSRWSEGLIRSPL